MIDMIVSDSVPNGYLMCDGAAVDRATYADLFAIIGTTYGNGDGSTTFNVPDLRNLFIRGFPDGRGSDSEPNRAIGSIQPSLTALPRTPYTAPQDAEGAHGHTGTLLTAGAHSHGVRLGTTSGSSSNFFRQSGGSESRGVAMDRKGEHRHTITVANAGGHTHNAGSPAFDSETRPQMMSAVYVIST